MARNPRFALDEIIEEIDWLGAMISGRSLSDFSADRALRYAVERAIEIISEASRRIPAELKSVRPEIDWRGVGDIGNFLRHEYHSTAVKIIWDVVQTDLAQLRSAVEGIRDSLKP